MDAVVHLDNGKWGAIEVKLGQHQVPEATKNLKRLANKIDTDYMKKPSFLMVITSGVIAYRDKESGVWIVPITCLRN